MSECRYFHIEPGKGLLPLASLDEALAATRSAGYVWMDLFDPSREDLEAIAGPLGIHALSVEDCLDEDQIPKIEDFPGHSFVLFNRYRYANQELEVKEVDFLLGKTFLVTVSGHGGGARGAFEQFEKRVSLELAIVDKGPDFLLHTVLDTIVDDKLTAIETLEEDIEKAEENMLRDPEAFKLEDLVHLRHVLLTLRKSLFHEREILLKICRRDSPFVSEAAIYHFRDIYDHLTRYFEIAEMNRDILTTLTETYLSLVNNRMSLVANRTNRMVRRLTLITTVFMPLTLLAGVGGMSEWSMMTGPENWRISYPLFLLGLVVLGGLSFLLITWVERRDRRNDQEP